MKQKIIKLGLKRNKKPLQKMCILLYFRYFVEIKLRRILKRGVFALTKDS